jgi:hypothetical protein
MEARDPDEAISDVAVQRVKRAADARQVEYELTKFSGGQEQTILNCPREPFVWDPHLVLARRIRTCTTDPPVTLYYLPRLIANVGVTSPAVCILIGRTHKRPPQWRPVVIRRRKLIV